MRSISRIGFKNFRVFEQSEFDLKPITLITGANSSGKSTLFKSLLLLKQNVQNNENLENLILSNKPYFLGTFETTKNNNNEDDYFSLIFGFEVLPFKLDGFNFDFRIEYHYKQSGENAKLSNIIISNNKKEIVNVSIDEYSKTKVNENEIIKLLRDYDKIVELINNKHLDEFFAKLESDENSKLKGIISEYADFNFSENSITQLVLGYEPDAQFEKPKHNYVEGIGFKVKKEKDETYFDFLTNNEESQNGLNDIAKTIIRSDIILGKRKFNHIYKDKDIYERLSRDAISRLFGLQSSILTPNENIKAFIDFALNFSERIIPNTTEILIDRLKNIEYLSSNRSRLSRYYQNSNEFSEFDKIVYDYSQSDEIELFEDKPDFINEWLRKFDIGEKLSVERSEGILSFVYIENKGIKRNIADFGFGIIQLLPILMKIAVIARKQNSDGTILLIEEPEANLHPKFQSILTELFIKTSKEYNIHFIIETHSEYLIRELQIQIANSVISPDDVAIFYVNKSFGETKKQLETIGIDESGKIEIEKFGDEFYKYSDKQEISLLNINRNTFVEKFNLLKQKDEDNENKISELEQKIDDFTNKLDIQEYHTVISQRFDTSKLSNISIKYLASGQFLLHTIDDNCDFSPVILQYGRTIENELKEIFIAIGITDVRKLMLGKFQGALEKYKTGTSIQGTYSNNELSTLPTVLSSRFNNPTDLRIELLNEIRKKRNNAGHSGQTNTKLQAIDYIDKANEFLDKWIDEKK